MEYYRLSATAQKAMARAAEESVTLGHHFLGVEHIFVALSEGKESPLARAFEVHDVDFDRVLTMLRRRVSVAKELPWGDDMLLTQRCREVLQIAGRLAARDNAYEVQQVHLLEAIFREGRSVPLRLLRTLDVDPEEVYEALKPAAEGSTDTRGSTLSQLGRDLTAQARLGRLSPVIGRAAELDLVAQVLLRRNKNNPVLVGEAGVGKSAVVEGLARKLVSEDCPDPLKGSRIVELSTGSLVAGTKFRGEFEQRLLDVVKEASADPRLILFLDEIHTLVGAGTSAGEALDASNILKPALARGEFRCIGATTTEEYRRFIERDAALERRFEPILVEEPTRGEAHEILQGLKGSLERHHQVELSSEALTAAVDLTVRYMPNRRLPDKAIDALDQTCARVRLRRYTDGSKERGPVSPESVAGTVSQWTGIPLERIEGKQADHLLRLEDELRESIVGQDHAVRAVARAVLTAKAGLSAPDRPTGVFLFLGPTGVGKTELARTLAGSLFGDPKKLIRFDMSEYTESHSVAKLIGAPPGYVGHENEGLLISAVRTHPYSVVLFDEMEKAHPQVFDLFLQIFDDGRLQGARGAVADFTNAVIILTSNIRQEVEEKATMGFVPEPTVPVDSRALLTQHLRPELVNRLDEIVVFNVLDKSALRQIIDRYVREIEALAASRDLVLSLDDAVYGFLIDQAAGDRFGARELRRVVDRKLRHPLAELLVRHAGKAGEVHAVLGEGGIDLRWAASNRDTEPQSPL